MNSLRRVITSLLNIACTGIVCAQNSFPANGNVGIGAGANPSAPLTVWGPFISGHHQLSLRATGSDDRSGLSFWGISGNRVGVQYASTWGEFVLGLDQPGMFRFFSGGGERMRIDNAGNVSIGGFTSPNTRLHVEGGPASFYRDDWGNDTIVLRGQKDSANGWGEYAIRTGYYGILFRNTQTDASMLFLSNSGNVGVGTGFSDPNGPSGLLNVSKAAPPENSTVVRIEGRSVGHSNYALLSAGHGAGQTFVVKADGKVGIGTASPTHLLSVNGSVRAREIVVETTDWADYVFEDGYPLTSLHTLEQYIQKHKRLPGVPSAAQVLEEGVNLAEMQSKLLAKVEEITLHQIAQAKEIETLRTQNAALQARVQELECR